MAKRHRSLWGGAVPEQAIHNAAGTMRLSMVASLHDAFLRAAYRSCSRPLCLVFAYSCGYNFLLLTAPIYLLQIYDRVLSSRSVDTLLMLTLIVSITVVVGGLLDALRRTALGRIGTWLDERTRPAVLSVSLDCAAGGNGTRAIEIYRDVSTISQFLGSGAAPLLFDVAWSPLFVGVLFLIHPLLGVAGATSIITIVLIAIVGEFASEGHTARAGAALAQSYRRLGVATANIHLLRAMGMVDGAREGILADARDAAREQRKAQHRAEVLMLVSKPFRALSQIIVMGLAAWLVVQHDKSPAIIFAASLLFGRALAPVEGAISGWKPFAMSVAACRRIFRAAGNAESDERPRDPEPESPEGPLVIGNVSVSIPGSADPLLKSVSLRLDPGECLGIIGLSGSGKSLLGRVISGVQTPSRGHVTLGGVRVEALQRIRGARHLGYMPQEIELVGRSVSDIIGRLGEADFDEVVRAAKLVGLHETIMRLPNAYASDVADGSLVLLRGHRQRLGLARALCGNPRLVVLDEPNASLDYLGEQMLLDVVQEMKAANTTVVIITHRMGILAATDKIAIMQAGALSAFASRDEIFAQYIGRPPGETHNRAPARITPRSTSERSRTPSPALRAKRRPAPKPTEPTGSAP